MGYTHYWKILKVPVLNSVKKVLDDAVKIRFLSKAKIQFSHDDDSPPVFTEQMIRFNGVEGDAHENFDIDFTNTKEFSFCKTARKPYDEVVCLLLLSMKNHIDGF